MYSYVELACGSVPTHWRGNPWFFRILHYSVILVIAGLLAVFTNGTQVTTFWGITIDAVDGKFPPPVRRYWFVLIFLLSYIAIRFLIYLIGLLRESDGSDWPEIDAAWQTGLDGLEREGLDFQRLPIFLVTGLTLQSERRFFEGCQWQWSVIEPPADRPTPIRFYANREGIFLACSGISASSLQAWNTRSSSSVAPAVAEGNSPASPGLAPGTMRGVPAAAIDHTSTPRGFSAGLGGTLKNIASMVQATLGPRALSGISPTETPSNPDMRAISGAELEVCRSQMAHLAMILRRDRTYCPINGVLQLIPFDWVTRRRQHVTLVRSVRKDYEALSQTLHLQFPVVLGLVGIDELAGYDSYIRRCRDLDPQSLLARAGTSVATGAIFDEATSSYVSQMISNCFRDKAYESFLADLDNRSNSRVYNLVCALDDEVDNLKHLLQALGNPHPQPLSEVRHAGAYLAGLGEVSEHRAFLLGLLAKMLNEQNQVAYTAAELRRDRLMYLMAIILFIASAGVFAGAGYLGWKTYQDQTTQS